MKVLKSIDSVRKFITEQKKKQVDIGFVPTMGALHQGHLQLVKNSLKDNDITIVSIYVNPSQFSNIIDFESYPDTLSNDTLLLEQIGCDALFLPTSIEIYPEKDNLAFNFGYLEKTMEGEFRSGHFSGVGLIVSKLFNIIEPTRAYFGEKDLQQLTIIKKLTSDLNFNIQIIGVPTVRESSGLAMSSRNMRLSEDEKLIATNIYKGLTRAKKLIAEKTQLSVIKEKTHFFFSNIEKLDVEYIEFVDSEKLTPLAEGYGKASSQKISICIAAQVGDVRLIDNITFAI